MNYLTRFILLDSEYIFLAKLNSVALTVFFFFEAIPGLNVFETPAGQAAPCGICLSI